MIDSKGPTGRVINDMVPTVQGLDLCERYFLECGLPQLQSNCEQLLSKMTIGLIGDGSECLGFDDDLSRDHDWGPGFCIWLNSSDYLSIGPAIQKVYESLPGNFSGFKARTTSAWGNERVGVLDTGKFYRRYLGRQKTPETLQQWLMIPENALATATNGKIFHDSNNDFSRIRADLLHGYPEDVRLKKIVARCMQAGQAGQYNYPRALKRKSPYAAMQACAQYCDATLSLIFLFNNHYFPFYKWAHLSVKKLPVLGQTTYDAIFEITTSEESKRAMELIEELSQKIIKQLQSSGLSSSNSDFLVDHGPEVQVRIKDKGIRQLNPWVG